MVAPVAKKALLAERKESEDDRLFSSSVIAFESDVKFAQIVINLARAATANLLKELETVDPENM